MGPSYSQHLNCTSAIASTDSVSKCIFQPDTLWEIIQRTHGSSLTQISPYKIAQKHSHKHSTELTFTADHIVSHIETRRAPTTETTLPVFLTVTQIGVVVTRTMPSITRKFLVRIHSVLDLPRQYLELTSSKKRTLQKWE